MSQPWFRYYAEALDDPKVQKLSDALFKTWVNLLCLATLYDGTLPGVDEIAFKLRVSEKEAEKRVAALMDAKLLERDGVTLQPHNWGGRQFKSDDSNERVRRYRQRNKKHDSNTESNVTNNNDVTLQETDSETDTEEGKKIVSPKSSSDLQPAVDAWNDMAHNKGLSKVQRLTDPRRRSLTARLSECGGLPGWAAALRKVEESSFLLGENKTNWRADFDFLLQQKSFTKLLEGGYDGSRNTANNDVQRALEDERERLRASGEYPEHH